MPIKRKSRDLMYSIHSRIRFESIINILEPSLPMSILYPSGVVSNIAILFDYPGIRVYVTKTGI